MRWESIVFFVLVVLLPGLIGFLFLRQIHIGEYCDAHAADFLHEDEAVFAQYDPTDQERDFFRFTESEYKITGFSRGLKRCYESKVIW